MTAVPLITNDFIIVDVNFDLCILRGIGKHKQDVFSFVGGSPVGNVGILGVSLFQLGLLLVLAGCGTELGKF